MYISDIGKRGICFYAYVAEIKQVLILQYEIIGYRLVCRNVLVADYLIELEKNIYRKQIEKRDRSDQQKPEKQGIADGTAVKACKHNGAYTEQKINYTVSFHIFTGLHPQELQYLQAVNAVWSQGCHATCGLL